MLIYLAGPEVFLAEAAELAAAKQRICAAHGLTGIFPTDPPPQPPPAEAPEWLQLYLSNEAHIRRCDALIANLTPFRGPSADPGTVFELGFMRALGRPVFGYSNTRARFGSRTLAALGPAARRRAPGVWEDDEGMAVEDFDLADNLMVEGGIHAAGGSFHAHEAAPAERWQDFSAFTACVVAAAVRLRGG